MAISVEDTEQSRPWPLDAGPDGAGRCIALCCGHIAGQSKICMITVNVCVAAPVLMYELAFAWQASWQSTLVALELHGTRR